ncbi:MAG TPA: porin [Rhodocyclaceae bacterium]
MRKVMGMAGIALAFLAVSAPVPASAFEKSIEFYGVVDVSLGVEKAGAVKRIGFEGGELDGSRIGVKGKAAFSDDFTGVFVLEAGFDPGTGQSEQDDRLFGRQAYAGVEGAFGRVTGGRQYSPAFVALDPLEATGGAARSVGILHRTSDSVRRGYNVRFDDMVKYRTPSWGGFFIDAGYWVGDENASAESQVRKEGSGSGVAAVFDGEILSVAAVTQRRFVNDTGGLATTRGGGVALDFGPVKLFAQATRDRESGSAGTGEARTASVGVRFRILGKNTLALSVARRDESGEPAATDVSGASLYYLRALDRETTMYLAYSRLANKVGAKYRWNFDPQPGEAVAAVMVGLRHKF